MFSRRGAKSAASQSTDLAAPRCLQTKPPALFTHGAARCLPFPSHLCFCCHLYLNLHSNPTRNYTHCTLLRLKSFTFTPRTKVALWVFMSLMNLDLKIVLIISAGLFLAMKLSPPYNWRVAVPWARLFALTPQHLHPPLGAATQLIPHKTWHCSTVTWIKAVQKLNKFCILDSKLLAPALLLGYHESGVKELCLTNPAKPYQQTQYHLLYLGTADLALMWKMHRGAWLYSVLNFSFNVINSTTCHRGETGLDNMRRCADKACSSKIWYCA